MPQNANIANPLSILKQPQTVNSTKNPNTKSVIFQAQIRIPENILPSWRRARSALASAAKARLRAHHFGVLRTLNQPTLWALGVGKYPNFLPLDNVAKAALVNAKRAHALDCMQIVQQSLTRKATAEGSLGATFRTATQELFGDDNLSKPALDMLTSLVEKEKGSVITTLNTRVANVQANPITNEFILSTMIPVATNCNHVPPPPTTTRGRGRGRGRGQTQNQRRRSVSPTPGPSTSRGTGRPRGRGASRGNRGGYKGPNYRSRSPNHLMTQNLNQVRALSAEEILVINSLRAAKNLPQI